MGTYLPGAGPGLGASIPLPPPGGVPPLLGGIVATMTWAGPGWMALMVYLPSTMSEATTCFSPAWLRKLMVPDGNGAPWYFTVPLMLPTLGPHPQALRTISVANANRQR